MKLIVQADDYSMTDAVAEGILKCANEGVLTQVFAMTNGPHSEYYIKKLITEHPNILLGLEINLFGGRPVSDPKMIPSLVDENGKFIRSIIHADMDRVDPLHVSYQEAFIEIEAQYKKYVDYTGAKPSFIALHSYSNEEFLKALKLVEEKYELNNYFELMKAKTDMSAKDMGPWNSKDKRAGNSLDYQFSRDPMQFLKDPECQFLMPHIHDENYVGILHTHAGFVDRDLLDMSSLHITRVMELDLLCSDFMKNLIKENGISLINFKDLEK